MNNNIMNLSTKKTVLNSTKSSSRLKIFFVPLILTVALCGGTGLYVWNLYNSFKKVQTEDLKILELGNEITYLDEVLTASARLLVTSNNKQWEERYLAYVPKLDAAIAEAQKLLPQLVESESLKQTDEANKKLVDMETKSFDLVHQGKIKEAQAVLFGAEYDKQKKIYAKGLEESTTALKKYVEGKIAAKAQETFLAIVLIAIGFTILMLFWIAVLRMTKNYIQAINNMATVLSKTSTEIATTVAQQERNISQQATSVHETTTTVEQMGSASRQAAEQAEASAAGARQALSLAENGSQAVQETMEGMSTLKEQVRAIAEQILRLSEQTGQIAGISDLVADLANQTNMLALNAAVEAARAGDSGKGFAVVAGEIRKLADESKKSAEKINTLVTDVQSSMNSTVMVTDEGTKKVDLSIQLAQGTAATFMSMADAVNNVYLNSQQISLSSKQQVVGVQQIVAAMNALNLGAQETSTGINQVKVSTQHLQESATKLQQVA
jgi:methyl-accepting chemotaxis protein